MSSRTRCVAGVFAFLGFAILAGMVSTAQATLIADWQFTEGNFLADSAGSHTLTKVGTVGDTGGVASFSNAGILTTDLDLSGYSKIRVSWSWLVKTDDFGVFFTNNYPNQAGTISVSLNEVGAGTTRAAMYGGGYIDDIFTHNHGDTNSTWDNLAVVYDLTTAVSADSLTVYNNGNGTGYTENYGTVPSSFIDNWFAIGGASNDGMTFSGAGMIGQLDRLTIESIPEPTSMIMLTTGLIGLLAYAWRRRQV